MAEAPGVLLLAHRGVHGAQPENSLAALRAAFAAQGIKGVEFDVRHAADGTPIVLHDATLERIQRWKVPAASLTPGVLEGFGVPTLAAVLAVCPADAFLDVELKERPTERTFAPLLAARGTADGGLANAVISAFEPESLAAVRVLQPGWPVWLNVEGALGEREIGSARDLGCAGISADVALIDEVSAVAVAGAGLVLAAWTVRDRATLARLESLGVIAACVEGDALPAPER